MLFTGGVFGLYVPTGHLLYAVGEAIRAVPVRPQPAGRDRTRRSGGRQRRHEPTDGAAAFDVSENGTLAYLPVSSYVTESDLVLVDRRGNETTGASRQRPLRSPAALSRRAPHRGRHPLGQLRRETSGSSRSDGRAGPASPPKAAGTSAPEWTPDGRELIYISERPFFDLYRRAADASRPAEPLLTGGHDHYTGTVSRGRPPACRSGSASTGGSELWTVPLAGRAARRPRYLANGFNLAHPVISPDGRWMAYDSDESGRVEVYVQSFPDPSLKRWKVSPDLGVGAAAGPGAGGSWSIRKGDSVMAVSVDLENGRIGSPSPCSPDPIPTIPGWTRPRSYDVSRDGERFLMTKLPKARPGPGSPWC